MNWAMTLVRELRELDDDYEWLRKNENNMGVDNYCRLRSENRRIYANMLDTIEKHMTSC